MAFTRPEPLLQFLGLDPALASEQAARAFRQRVPRGFAALMERGNPNDPLLRQVLPSVSEAEDVPGFSVDPVGDAAARSAPGLLQKYQGRALLVTTGACAVHCRYCFRRHFPYAQDSAMPDRARSALATIAAAPDISEVILSGGDPLMLDDDFLCTLVRDIARIPHVKRIRLHTRLPVVLPARVTPALCQLLADTRLQTLVVIHANHARELGLAAAEALARLRAVQVPLLNQAVLLRGINDDVEELTALSERLFELGVISYYLHQLDRVAGAAHFEVDARRASALMAGLRARVAGYLVPRLVREVARATSKIPLA